MVEYTEAVLTVPKVVVVGAGTVLVTGETGNLDEQNDPAGE